MRVLNRQFYNVSRSDVFVLVPLGDLHLGATACDEELLGKVVERIRIDKRAYWVGLGDYVDGLLVHDKRFAPGGLASWLMTPEALTDIARAQRDRFLEIVKPIAHKCLALVEGNHETSITKHYERAIYQEIVTGVKEAGGFPADHQLALGYDGFLVLDFYRSETKERGRRVTINLHHGYGGGKLAGAKALEMQRRLKQYDCDLVLMGHVHEASTRAESVYGVDEGLKIIERVRRGAWTGTFLKTINEDGPATYAEVKGYPPSSLDRVEVWLRPGVDDQKRVITLVSGQALP